MYLVTDRPRVFFLGITKLLGTLLVTVFLVCCRGDTKKGQSSKRVEWRGLRAMAEFWTATQEILQGSDPMVRKPKVRDRVPLTPGSRPIPPLDSFSKIATRHDR